MAPLIHTNEHLADPAKRRAMLVRSVRDSSRMEGIRRVRGLGRAAHRVAAPGRQTKNLAV